MLADKEILWLAESYKPNADATEWTITFRKGIKWSDGTAFKASDAAWTMEKLKTVAGVKTAGSFPKELDKVEAVDDTHPEGDPQPDRLALLLQET